MRLPKHIGIIPDGNRRWALGQGKEKREGYEFGLDPGLSLYRLCSEMGIAELTYYGFTIDNTKRPPDQRLAYTDACVRAVKLLANEDAALLVIGNTASDMFPMELVEFTNRRVFGSGKTKVNFLVNYGWEWDLMYCTGVHNVDKRFINRIRSSDISRVDLIIRWGGRRRLSGFLPVQSVYADFYVIDDFWPDFKPEHLYEALDWYNKQDVTLGG